MLQPATRPGAPLPFRQHAAFTTPFGGAIGKLRTLNLDPSAFRVRARLTEGDADLGVEPAVRGLILASDTALLAGRADQRARVAISQKPQ